MQIPKATFFIKAVVLSIFCCLLQTNTSAQSDTKLSNYTFTPLTLNPAYAGSYGGLVINSFYTSQWTGFEGAPQTLFVNGHDRFENSRVGLGLNFVNDQIGASSDTRVSGNFAYHLPISTDWTFSAGIKAGISNYSIDYSLLSPENPEELSNPNGDFNTINPIIGTGLYVYNEQFYFGFSVPDLLTSSYKNEYKNNTAKTRPNFFFNAGYNWQVNSDFKLQPSVMTRVVKGAPTSTLFSLIGNWQEKLYGSVNFEANVSIGGFFGLRFLENFMGGYAYDAGIGEFSKYNGGIHSFFLSFRVSDLNKRRRCSCFSY